MDLFVTGLKVRDMNIKKSKQEQEMLIKAFSDFNFRLYLYIEIIRHYGKLYRIGKKVPSGVF
jgi:hypothetical protein